MQPAGQVLAQIPQPTHIAVSTTAKQPFQIDTAFLGHAFRQAPQETQIFLSGSAHLFFLIFSPSFTTIKNLFLMLSYQKEIFISVIRLHYRYVRSFSLSIISILPRERATTPSSTKYFRTFVTTSLALPMKRATSSWVRRMTGAPVFAISSQRK